MPNDQEKILKEEKELLKSLDSKIGKLAISLERARIDEYTSMMTRPWKFFFMNLVAGLFRGVGTAIGMTLVAALVIYILVKVLVSMVDLPIIGLYIAEVVKFVSQYMQQGIPAR